MLSTTDRPTPHPRTPDADSGSHHERDGGIHVSRLAGFPAELPSRRPAHRKTSTALLLARVQGGAA